MGFRDRLQHAWNIFTGRDSPYDYKDLGMSYYNRPDRIRLTRGNERSIITSVYNRISLDAAANTLEHVRLDDNKRYLETLDGSLNNCLELEANIDQTGRAFLQDIVMSMLDEGCVAVVPTDTDSNINNLMSFDIYKMRTGKIVQWFPEHIRVRLYNEKDGQFGEVTLPKKSCAIIENPFYAVMNEPNSTMQRLARKLSLLDLVDEQAGSGKLDLIIQLPYSVKSDLRKQQAEARRKDIEKQLTGSKYGIAYVDSTEHITQLNRSLENNLLHQIEYLQNLFYSQLGITTGILDGSADEKTMNNYYSRIIEPILSAITDEMKRKFLTKTARTQKQSIMYFRDPFKLIPTNELAELADTFTRNEIMTSNEFRQIVGMRPSQDPGADELRNKNVSMSNEQEHVDVNGNPIGTENQNGMEMPVDDEEEMTALSDEERIAKYKEQLAQLDDLDSQLDELEGSLGDEDEEEDDDEE